MIFSLASFSRRWFTLPTTQSRIIDGLISARSAKRRKHPTRTPTASRKAPVADSGAASDFAPSTKTKVESSESPSQLSRFKTLEITAVLLIIVVAALVRFWNLSDLPTGMHGDEAVAGMVAQQVLREGSVGVYSTAAAGQPTGPIYLLAIPIAIWGNTIFAVRALAALMGTLTVAALYGVLRRRADAWVSLLGAAFLATLNWHLHFSRIGFPLIAWPLACLVAAAVVLEAARRQSWVAWALAGAATAAGVYVYNAHLLFACVIGLWVVLHLALARHAAIIKRLTWFAVFVGAAILTLLPMIFYAFNPQNGYFDHFNRDSLRATSQWQALPNLGAKLVLLATRYVGWWDTILFHPHLDDTVDTVAVATVVPFSLLLLIGAGMLLGAWRRGPLRSMVGLSWLVVLLMPLGGVLTVGGLARRPFAMTPFLAFLAAVGVVELGRLAHAKSAALWRVAAPVLGLLSTFAAWQNLNLYFGAQPRAPMQAWAYCEDFTAATLWMRDLPRDNYVYFLSERWTFNYEPRQFLAPHAHGEDRSREFGGFSLEANPSQGKPIWVLVGNYKPVLGELQRLYPGGRIINGQPSHQPPFGPRFIAYLPTSQQK